MGQVMVEITRAQGQTQASFQPDPAVATSQDNLFWVNNDETSGHQPTPDLSDPTAWMEKPIPVKLPGQPAPQSRGLAFPAGKDEIEYFCAVPGHGESGTIQVTS